MTHLGVPLAAAQFEKSAAVDPTWPGLSRPAEYHLQGANTSKWRGNNCQHLRNKLTSEENDIMKDICKNKEYLKKQNLFDALSLLHKLIVNKLIPINNVNDDENAMNPTMSLEDVLAVGRDEQPSSNEQKSHLFR